MIPRSVADFRPRFRSRGAIVCAVAAAVVGCDAPAPPELGPEVVVASGYGGHPTVALDATGSYYVTWVGAIDEQWDVYLARSDDGVSFSAPVRVNDVPGDAAPHAQAPAQVATGPEGHVYVLWQNNTHADGRRFPYSDLRLARSTDGGHTFEPAITVNDDAGGPPSSHTFHDIAVAANGTVYVSWIDSRVRARTEMEAGGNTPPHAIEGEPASAAQSPHGGDSGHGGPGMDGMHDPSLPGPEIRIAWSTDGGRTFGESVVVAGDACPCCRTSLAIGNRGEIFLAWRGVEQGSIRDIVVARSTDGGRSFTPPVPVHRDGWRIDGCPHAGASLAIDSAGVLHAAWYTGAERRAGLYHVQSLDGGFTFGTPTPIVTGDWVPVSQVRLAASHDGLWLVWEDRRPEVPRIRLARLEARKLEAQHPDSASPGTTPALAGHANNQAVAWLQDGAVRFRPGRSAR